MRKLTSALDGVVRRLIGEVDAGACVPSVGECCARGTHKYHSCTGTCIASSVCP
jgi:hypothetical protein